MPIGHNNADGRFDSIDSSSLHTEELSLPADSDSGADREAWTSIGNASNSNDTMYLLLGNANDSDARLFGSIVGYKDSGQTSRTLDRMDVAASINANGDIDAVMSVTRAASHDRPYIDLVTCDYGGSEWIAIECDPDGAYFGWDGGLYFSGLKRDMAGFEFVPNTDVSNVSSFDGGQSIWHSQGADFTGEITSTGNNNHLVARPGEVQARLDDAASRGTFGVVRLVPGETYDEGSEIVIPEGVTLDCTGAFFEPTTDHDIFFMQPKSRLIRPHVDVNSVSSSSDPDFTSNVLTLDTERANSSYHIRDETHVEVIGAYFRYDRQEQGGNGIHLNSVSESIAGLQNFQATVYGFENGLNWHAEIHNNSTHFHLFLWRCDVAIRQSGGGPFESRIWGEMQGTNTGSALIVNEDDVSRTFRFIGQAWDTHLLAENNGEGVIGHVNMELMNNPDSLIQHSPQGSGRIQVYRRGWVYDIDVSSGKYWQWRHNGDDMSLHINRDPVHSGSSTDRLLDIRDRGDRAQLDLRGDTDLINLSEYDNDSAPMDGTLYYNPSDGQLKYKDPSGTVHTLHS